MARFYGTIRGGRGEATRLGHATSGLYVTAQSYSGDVCVSLSAVGGIDYVSIFVRGHDGCNSKCIYHGPIAKLLEQSARATMLQALALEELQAA